MNRLEDGSVSLSMGGSQFRVMGVSRGGGVGAGVVGGTVGVLDRGRWESWGGLSVTLGAGASVVAGADRGFEKGLEAAAGGFFRLAEALPSFGSSLFSAFFLMPCFSLALFRSLHPPAGSTLSPLLS